MLHWQNVLVRRNHRYNITISAFATLSEANPALHQLGYREKAWSVNQLGAAATSHGLTDTALLVLATMWVRAAGGAVCCLPCG